MKLVEKLRKFYFENIIQCGNGSRIFVKTVTGLFTPTGNVPWREKAGGPGC